MKDFFYLNGSAGAVVSCKAEGNRIILELNAADNACTLSYLPLFVPQDGPFFPFLGPYLANKNEMRAFTFLNVPISTALKPSLLTAATQGNTAIKLNWEAIPGAEEYLLERRASDNNSFTTIARLKSNTLQFTDELDLSLAPKLFYRVKAISKDSESSDYAQVEIQAPLMLAVEEHQPVFSVFPNPVVKGEPITVTIHKPERGTLDLLHSNGQSVFSYPVIQQKQIAAALPDLSAGIYILQFKSKDKSFSKKLLVR
ncbi:T9SS type A sorting domain-containing protein [Dyadobacter sp. MSC1_007]|jgi:hypothetical protein|uniref:T9SS type A sorting domain-containing protein n=1 Tax=Dyadobacter sp. MSC1_007 TaxID=2909264 RepID=UPI002030C9D8|nr:T9SS type A sorting domain-containing protein [Dyadobacter sp. MSC1_007]